MKDRYIQFNLIIPFSDHNYCNLEALKPLYETCEGDVLYPKVDEIEQAFAESKMPSAFKAHIFVSAVPRRDDLQP